MASLGLASLRETECADPIMHKAVIPRRAGAPADPAATDFEPGEALPPSGHPGESPVGERPVGEGVLVDAGGRHVVLKWHKLRRRSTDIPFDPGNLRLGLALGAAMEVDLRLAGDGGFVCLQEADLEAETDGAGRVRDARGGVLAGLRVRDGAGRPSPVRVMLLEDLVAALAAAPPGGERLHLDLGDPAEALDRTAILGFAALVEPVAERLELGGRDWRAVRALGRDVRGLVLGYDPTSRVAANWPLPPGRIRSVLERTMADAPEARWLYLMADMVAAAARQGIDMVDLLAREGRQVDVRTIDAHHTGAAERLADCVRLGVLRVTTNTPLELDRLWRAGAWSDEPGPA